MTLQLDICNQAAAATDKESRPMSPTVEEFVTETFEYDGGRQVTVYVPPDPAEAVVFAGDGGWHISRLAGAVDPAIALRTMVVGVHGLPDDDGRLKEYVPGFDESRFAAHERFFVEDVRLWVQTRFRRRAAG
jgi:hypothetical protein